MPPLPLLLLLGAGAPAQGLRFHTVKPEIVTARLSAVPVDNRVRADTLHRLFEEAGCGAPHLTRQSVKGSRTANIVCLLPGESDQVIVVGAHHDHAPQGQGAVDNWSGASLLPSLYQGHALFEPRRFTWMFVGFTDEERGLLGSSAFVKTLGREGLRNIRAMINIDSVGMSPTKVWVSRSDKVLLDHAWAMAAVLQWPLSGVDAGNVGDSDSRPFHERCVPVIDFHSITQELLPVLHSPSDTLLKIQAEHYQATYELLAALLAALLARLDFWLDRPTEALAPPSQP